MDRRVVLAAGLLIGAADREVDRPPEFLVEEDVLCRPRDTVVRPDPKLAEAPGALVGVEHRVQVLLALLRARLHDLAALEPEADPRDLAPGDRDRYPEVDLALGGILDGARKDLAARHVVHPVPVKELPAPDAELEVRPRALDAHLVGLLEALYEPALLLRLLLPVRDRVVLVQRHRREDELLVVREAHLGLLSQGGSREERQRPAVLAEHDLLDVLVPLAEGTLLARIHRRQRLRVLRRHDRDEGVGALVDAARYRGRLLVVALPRALEEHLLHPRELDLRYRHGPDIEKIPVDLLDQGLGRDPAGDDHLIALPRPDGILYEQPGQLLQPLIHHKNSPPLRDFERAYHRGYRRSPKATMAPTTQQRSANSSTRSPRRAIASRAVTRFGLVTGDRMRRRSPDRGARTDPPNRPRTRCGIAGEVSNPFPPNGVRLTSMVGGDI